MTYESLKEAETKFYAKFWFYRQYWAYLEHNKDIQQNWTEPKSFDA